MVNIFSQPTFLSANELWNVITRRLRPLTFSNHCGFFCSTQKTLKSLVNQTWTIQKQQRKWRENKQSNETGEKRRFATGERLHIAPWQTCEFSARFKAGPQRNHSSATKLGVNRSQIWNWICGDESEVIADDVMICLFIFTLCWWVEKETSFFFSVPPAMNASAIVWIFRRVISRRSCSLFCFSLNQLYHFF